MWPLLQNTYFLFISLINRLIDVLPYFIQRTKRKLYGPSTYLEESIQNKIAIVTGGNSGLGKTTVHELVKRGAKVVVACRNLVEGQKAIDEIKKLTTNGEMELLQLDLSSLESIRNFVQQFKTKYSQLDILINNAGFYDASSERKFTQDGFEQHIGVNHLGHFLLTNLLLEHLLKSGSSRVITVSSHGQIFQNLKLNDLNMKGSSYGLFNFVPYANSKFANSLFAKELGRRMEGTSLRSYSVGPGMVITRFYDQSKRWYEELLMNLVLGIFGESSSQGCETIIYLAVANEVDNDESNGHFFHFQHICTRIDKRLTNELGRDLWIESQKLVKLKDN